MPELGGLRHRLHLLAGLHEFLADGDEGDFLRQAGEPDAVGPVGDDGHGMELHDVLGVQRLDADIAVVGQRQDGRRHQMGRQIGDRQAQLGRQALDDARVRHSALPARRGRCGSARRPCCRRSASCRCSTSPVISRAVPVMPTFRSRHVALRHLADDEDGIEIDHRGHGIADIDEVADLRRPLLHIAVERRMDGGVGDIVFHAGDQRPRFLELGHGFGRRRSPT